MRFEVFTLGTLAVIVLIGILGYIAGAGVRAKTVNIGAQPTTSQMRHLRVDGSVTA